MLHYNGDDPSLQFYLETIGQYPDIRDLPLQDNSPRNDLINSSLRYVVHVAKRYARDTEELRDFIQDGSVGLLKAFEHYDSSVARFLTYAHFWITSEIRAAIRRNKGRNIIFDDVDEYINHLTDDNQNYFNTGAHLARGAKLLLSKREFNVLEKRLQGFSLREIGEEYGYTHENARLIINRAIGKLIS